MEIYLDELYFYYTIMIFENRLDHTSEYYTVLIMVKNNLLSIALQENVTIKWYKR